MKKTIYTLGALLTLFSVSSNAQINFQPAVYYGGSGTNTSDLASGDFNGDGFKDIVISNVFNSTYGTFLGSSTGTFTNSFNSAAIAFQPFVIAVADFDNDTKLDLAHTDNFSAVRTRGGTGIGTFTAVSNSAFATGNNLLDMIAADFNNDGKPDLATANNNGANITVALCSTTGTFGTSTNFAVGSYPYALTSGDFNNDGNRDIAVAKGTSTTGSVTVLFGDGLGSFGTPVNYVTGLGPRSVKTADFNGDGNLDLAVANYDSNNISILLGSSTGTFATAVNYNVVTNPTSLVCEDIDGDTNMDLGVTNANTVSVLKGSGSGTFSGGVNFSLSGLNASRLIADDFNNDTKIDLAVTQYNGMAVFLNSSVCSATISVNSGTICSDQSFTIVPSGASTYTYSGGSAVVSPTTTSYYTVTGTTTAGCVGTVTSTISVKTSPTINTVSSSVSNLCSGNSTNLSVSGWSGPALTSYTWNTGSNASNITVSPTVTTTYSVSVTNTLGCTSNQFAFTQTVNNCVIGTAFNFDGVDDYINAGTSVNNVLAGTNKITIEAWIRATTNQAGIIVTNLHTGANTGGQFQLRTQPSGANKVYFDFFTDNSAGTAMLGMTGGAGNPFNINEWHHVAATWDGTLRTTYIDGVFSNSSSSSSLAQFQSCTNNLLIGARTNTFPAMFNGDIDDLRIWNRALCADEINHVKNGELPATYYPDLIAYYKFNEGVVGGNNYSTNSSITNATSSSHTGLIMNTPLTGATSNFVAGNTAINGNTVSASFTSTCQVTNSIYDIGFQNGFDFYPNPANEILNVELENLNEIATISIINALGEVVLTEKVMSNNIILKTNNLINGVYFIKVESNRGAVTKKFIKE